MKCFVLIKATLTLEYLIVNKCLLTRESYMSRSQWEYQCLERFQEQIKNKPYRSSLAQDLRFTTYRDDTILFLCRSNQVNYAYEFYKFSFERIKGKHLDQ